MEEASGYYYGDAEPGHTNAYLVPTVLEHLAALPWPNDKRSVFDLGCGNGAVAVELARQGYAVQGVDPSEDAVRIANQAYPEIPIRQGSAYDDLAAVYGQFLAVVSLEVVEHLYDPRCFAACVHALLKPGGIALISTPYHGYFKNLALALAGKFDKHFTALWDHGHIKFWSIRTLSQLLAEAGLKVEQVHRLGRLPILAKSMLVVARRPT